MFETLRARLMEALSKEDIEPPYVPVIRDGEARISDPDQIPESYCDISSKDTGERYLGLRSGATYIKVHPWELNG